MQQGIKRGLAVVLSAVLTVSLLLNTFSIGVFAQDDPVTLTDQIVAQLEQEGVEPGNGATEETPAVSAVPTQQPEATVEPTATAWPEATETPEPSVVPEPSASVEPTETPAPTVTPAPTATAVPEQDSRQLTVEELKQQIKDLLEQSYSLTEMTEEELEESLGEINAITAVPATMAEEDQEDAELQELLDQLADAQVAMESMRMAWQAKREGWLDQLPQTGKENSWRYQNGTRIDQDENILDFDVPDGVSTFSAGGYWGIDVSHHQGVINWEAVKAAGIDFAIIRCGYGMNLTEQDDRQWSRNVSECERLGIPYGVYFYSYAMTADMAVEEGAHAVRLLEGHNPDLPVFYDLEENSQLVLGSGGLAEIARIFCDIVSSKGYEVGVYASLNWWQYYLTDAVFENWYRWVAEWRSSCSYNGRYEMWQYTSKGSINGISGNVDMNYWYAELPGASRVLVTEGAYTISTALDSGKVLDVEQGSTADGANVELFSRNGGANQSFKISACGDGYYTIQNINSGKYLDVYNGEKSPGTNVLQWSENGGDNQKWAFEDAGNGYYYIRSKASGLYLDVYNGESTDKTNVLVFTKNGGNNQKFRLNVCETYTIISGNYTISTALDSGKVLDVEQGSTADGANVELFSRNGGANQSFKISACGDGYYTIQNINSGKYLDVYNGEKSPGTNVLQWSENGGDNQKWAFEDAGNGYYYIRSKASGLYLDVYNGESTDKTNVLVFTKNGGNNQKFRLNVCETYTIISGNYTISTALDSGKVLDVEQGSTADGANVELFSRNGGANQSFKISACGDGYYTIQNINSGKYLDVYNGEKSPGTNVLQWSENGGDNQKWAFEDAGNGYYYIRSKASGLYLDVYNGESTDKTNVLVFTKNGADNQKFSLIIA